MTRLMLTLATLLACSGAVVAQQQQQPVNNLLYCYHEVDGHWFIDVSLGGEGWVLSPTTPRESPFPLAVGSTLVSRWIDVDGIEREVITHVPPTTNTNLYLRRHDALYHQMAQFYPPSSTRREDPPVIWHDKDGVQHEAPASLAPLLQNVFPPVKRAG